MGDGENAFGELALSVEPERRSSDLKAVHEASVPVHSPHGHFNPILSQLNYGEILLKVG